MNDRLIVCNLARLRECALRYGVRWESMEIDPATVLALVEAVQAMHDWQEFTAGAVVEYDDLVAILDRQERALALFTFEYDPEP